MKTKWEGTQERINTMENAGSEGERWKKSKRNIIIKIKWIWGKVIHMKVKERRLNIQIIGDTEKAVKIEQIPKKT